MSFSLDLATLIGALLMILSTSTSVVSIISKEDGHRTWSPFSLLGRPRPTGRSWNQLTEVDCVNSDI